MSDIIILLLLDRCACVGGLTEQVSVSWPVVASFCVNCNPRWEMHMFPPQLQCLKYDSSARMLYSVAWVIPHYMFETGSQPQIRDVLDQLTLLSSLLWSEWRQWEGDGEVITKPWPWLPRRWWTSAARRYAPNPQFTFVFII